MSRRVAAIAAAAAALAAATFVFQPMLRRSAGVAPGVGGGPPGAVRPLEPIGSIPRSPAAFRWTRDPEAQGYDFELLGRGGAVLYHRTTTDTTITVPQGRVDWNITATATWRVTPLGGSRNGVPSETVRFQLDTP